MYGPYGLRPGILPRKIDDFGESCRKLWVVVELLREGAVEFDVGNAFYRRSSALSRDLGVLAAIVYRQSHPQLQVLDGMSGCGVRSLRYLVEAEADTVWANDADDAVHGVLAANLAGLDPARYQITHRSAQALLYESIAKGQRFDLIDLDGFGNPSAFLGVALQALRFGGLLYVTSTDGRSISGQLPHQSMSQWGTFARSHPAVHEQALRILLGSLHQQATALGYGIKPIFSLYADRVWRVMVQLLPKARVWPPKQPIAEYGFLGYCHGCGGFQVVDWRSLGRVTCAAGQCLPPPVVSGPMWLGELADADWLKEMRTLAEKRNIELAAEKRNIEPAAELRGWVELLALFDLWRSEIGMPPYFYTLGEVGRRGKMDIPRRDRLAQALIGQGYRFSRTAIDPEGFKTDATLATCVALMQAR
jgi:tRNA (guanine26-N2/guanine27-N2)-dimethyltransferase